MFNENIELIRIGLVLIVLVLLITYFTILTRIYEQLSFQTHSYTIFIYYFTFRYIFRAHLSEVRHIIDWEKVIDSRYSKIVG